MPAMRDLSSSGQRVGQRTTRPLSPTDRSMPSPPRAWTGGTFLWRKLITSSRQYATTRSAKLLASDDEQIVEDIFNDLTTIASNIRGEISLAELQDWLRRPALLAHADVKALRNLLGLMDALEIF